MKQTAEDNAKFYGDEAASIVKHDFYVDDLLKSTPTAEAAVELIPKVIKMCAAGGFRLTKFQMIVKSLVLFQERSKQKRLRMWISAMIVCLWKEH